MIIAEFAPQYLEIVHGVPHRHLNNLIFLQLGLVWLGFEASNAPEKPVTSQRK